jgi:C_GCAxxG_C_C family probable redox protein
MNVVDRSVEVYRDDYNCAQAIFSIYGTRFGLNVNLSRRIACGLGAGMGRSDGMSGAVTGAFLVLGLKYGMADSARQEDKELTYEKVRRFIDLFTRRHGSCRCTDLLGCDISTPEGFKEAQEKNLMTTVCEEVVASAAEMLEELLASSECRVWGVECRGQSE